MPRRSPRAPNHPALHHVIVVGGTVREWGELDETGWGERVAALGDVAGRAGAQWLTLHPFERGPGADQAVPVHHQVVTRGSCTVTVDPSADGRERLVVALRKVADSEPLTERAVATALLAPATAEPDLVVLLSRPDRLPSSLVWELAYSELVYVDTSWSAFAADHLDGAIDEYRHRHRRFGGLD